MLVLALASLLVSAAVMYAIGAAVIAPRDSFLRTKFGITLLVAGALTFVILPPQLTSLGGVVDSAVTSAQSNAGTDADTSVGTSIPVSATDSVTGLFAWPPSLNKGAYTGIWAVTSVLSLLVGMRIWNAGKPGWRSGSSNAWDSSAAGRARGLLPLADSLAEALDVMKRTGVDARAVGYLAEELHAVGRRFAGELPASAGDTYSLVASTLPPAVASATTRLLLEGASEVRQPPVS